jgi:hypothetical protein
MRLNLEQLLREAENDFEYVDEDSDEIPEVGDVIRTKRNEMEGKVESISGNEVFFRIDDGRLMKTPVTNVITITKLADCDAPMMEAELNEISREVHSKYKKTNEAKFEFDKKTGGMKKDDSDPDQRHGLYLNGKLSKTYNTKQEADNVKKRDPKYKEATVKKIAEGSMGGINRVPNLGLKYDKVLDEVKERWKQEQMEAMDPWRGYTPDDPKANRINKAPASAVRGTVDNPLSDMIKDNIKTHGVKWAFQYHVVKHGLPPREFQMLAGLMPKKFTTKPLGEADDFGKILKKQHAEKNAPPKKKTDEQDYNGWTIRWELVPKAKGAPYKWLTWNKKRDPSTAKSGESPSAKQAYQDATAFINAGAGKEINYTKDALIDFNGEFSSEINPKDLTFYVRFDDGHLLLSWFPENGFSKASKRQQIGESKLFWSAPLKAAEAKAQNLVPNGRYILGEGEDLDPGKVLMFPIHFQNVVEHPRDRIRMGAPGFTIATTRPKEP